MQDLSLDYCLDDLLTVEEVFKGIPSPEELCEHVERVPEHEALERACWAEVKVLKQTEN